MDFRVTIGKEGKFQEWATFEQFYEATHYIERFVAQWNSISPDLPLYVTVEKVPSATPTLGVHIADETATTDRMG